MMIKLKLMCLQGLYPLILIKTDPGCEEFIKSKYFDHNWEVSNKGTDEYMNKYCKSECEQRRKH